MNHFQLPFVRAAAHSQDGCARPIPDVNHALKVAVTMSIYHLAGVPAQRAQAAPVAGLPGSR
jgi:hypothetical protein